MVILNDILDFSKIEAGKFLLEKFEFDLREKLSYLLKTFEMRAKEKAIDLTFHFDDNVPQIIMGDAYRLNQILVNLIGNSIKFTEDGGTITVSVHLHQDHGENIDLRIEVADSGIGISEDKLSMIFDSFCSGTSERRYALFWWDRTRFDHYPENNRADEGLYIGKK
jgi:signal transduction histidine kinase